jgi:tetratricopeptide (TPR) repeat protein
MGGKRSGTRQHVFLCVALLGLTSSCTFTRKEIPPPVAAVAPEPPPEIVEPEPPPEPEPEPEPVAVMPSKEELERRDAQQHLQQGQTLLGKGDYDGSLRQSQRALALAKNQEPADEALFNMALVFADPNNPKKDNRRAINLFNRILREYPESRLREQAKIWVGVLDGVEKLKQVDIEIEERKRDRTR